MGAGAVGSFFGGLLARAGAPVTLIGRAAHVAAIQERGLTIESDGRSESIRIKATTDAAGVAGARYVLVCVKSSATVGAAEAIAPYLAKDAVVLSLQNGVDNPERIRAHVSCPVVPVLVYAAVNMPAPGRISNTGGNRLVIGGADNALLESIAADFGAADIQVEISANVDVELWTKLLMNCAYNAVSALTRAPYAAMAAQPDIRDIMRAAAEEVAAVAAAKGIRIDRAVIEHMFDLAGVMPRTLSSTAQDIMKGRPTEIDDLNGYVARAGAALHIPTPVNAALNAMVRLRTAM